MYNFAAADGPLPFGDVAGVVVAGGAAIVAGGMYLDEKISQAKAKKKAKDCQDDEKEIKDKGDSQVKLPENTTDAGKKGSKAWNDAKKKIKDGRGKGVNTKTTSQEAAEELLNEARPEFRKETNLLKERKIWL